MADTSTDSTEEQEDLTTEEEVEGLAPDETSEEDQSTDAKETEETDESEAEQSDFQQRYTQFKGETPEEYAKNLEKGYDNSSKEAVKLSRENKTLKEQVDRVNALIAANPELATAINNGTTTPQAPVAPPSTDPALLYATSVMQKDFEREYNEFVTDHPEIETDPILAEQLDQKLAVVRDAVRANEGRMVGMGEGLKMAWAWLGKSDDTQEKVRMAAKDQASSTKSASGVKKGTAKPKFSEDQINVYMDMSGASRADAIKALSEYAPA